MAVLRDDPCVLCKIRKQRMANGLCDPCNALVKAEDSYKQLGIPKEPAWKTKLREKANRYNRLALKGMNQDQIAEIMGIRKTILRQMVYRAKTKLNMEMVNLVNRRAALGAPPAKTREIRERNNEHGGGRWGKTNCKCGPCAAVRRETKNEYAQAYRLVRKEREGMSKHKEQ